MTEEAEAWADVGASRMGDGSDCDRRSVGEEDDGMRRRRKKMCLARELAGRDTGNNLKVRSISN